MKGLQRSGLAILAVATMGGFTVGDDKPPAFVVTNKRDDDRMEVKVEKDWTIVSVHSPSGISRAVIERPGEKWPDALVLRLHLRGLEHLLASNGKVTLEASVLSHGDYRRQVRLWKDGKESTTQDAKSPIWTEIRMIGGDGRPTEGIPLKDGYFEIPLPKAFCEGNPKSITVEWIDFYRV